MPITDAEKKLIESLQVYYERAKMVGSFYVTVPINEMEHILLILRLVR